jgi:hypothetical protein
MPTKEQSRHVVPDQHGSWSVRKSGASRATRVFEKQGEAIAYAKDIGKREGVDIYIHGKDGTIREKNSYGSDPLPPKLKR